MTPIEKVYYAFYISKKEEMYFNEIKELSKLSNSSLQNTLKKLNLKKRKTKAHIYYKIKDYIPYFIRFDENRLNSLHYNVAVPLKEFREQLDNFQIVFFGSASRDEKTKESDIDLLVIKPSKNLPKNKKLNLHFDEIIEKARRNVSGSSVFPPNIFITDEKELNSMDPVIIQAILSGFPVKGHQRYYENIDEIKKNSVGKLISDFTSE